MSDLLEANWYEAEPKRRHRSGLSWRWVAGALFFVMVFGGVIVALASFAGAGGAPTCGGG